MMRSPEEYDKKAKEVVTMDAVTGECRRAKLGVEATRKETVAQKLTPYFSIDDSEDCHSPGTRLEEPLEKQNDGDEGGFIIGVVRERLKHLQVAGAPTLPNGEDSSTSQPLATEKEHREAVSGDKLLVGVLVPPSDDHRKRDADEFLPVVPLSRQNINRQSRPGAVSVTGPGLEVDEDEEAAPNNSPTTTTQAENSPNHDEGLAVASIVVDTPATNLPLAQSYDPEPQERKAAEGSKQGKIAFLLLGVAILAVAIVVIIVTVVHQAKPETEMTKATVPASNTTAAAPTFSVDSLLSLFPAATIVHIQEDAQSPQARALEWLVHDGSNLPSLSTKRIRQKFALATLYYSMAGNNWDNNTNWLNHNTHECEWFNQPSFSKTEVSTLYDGFMATYTLPTATCNEKGLYEHLWLIDNNLVGPIPEELYLLTGLVTLSLGWNQNLEGTISTLLGSLTAVEALGLNRVSLSKGATIPTEIGLLSNLHTILLGGSNVQGTVPREFWTLTTLDTFTFNFNPKLVGTIPREVARFSNLRWFVMDRSGFSGTLPTEFGLLESSEYIDIDGNLFSGIIPSQFGLLGKVTTLLMQGNLLDGSVPTQLGLATSAKLISVHGNQLKGSLPSELGLLTSLQLSLNFKGNANLSGEIPTELGLLTELHELDVSRNQFSGQIPSQLAQITSLGRLSVAGNSFSGTFPWEFAVLEHSLYSLELEDNTDLAGSIPPQLCGINATCIASPWFPLCEKADNGFSFDCTGLICGCGCSCL